MQQRFSVACWLLLAASGLIVAPLHAYAAPTAQGEPGPAGAPAPGSNSDASPELRLASIALTEADVPGSLPLYSRSSGPATGASVVPRYSVTFLADSLPASAAPGALVSVHNVVAVARDPAAGLDRFIRDLQEDWGSTIALPPPAVGEESRAVASAPPVTATSAVVTTVGVAFRRHEFLVGVAVSATGYPPPVEETIRLAQLVDARVMAAGHRSALAWMPAAWPASE